MGKLWKDLKTAREVADAVTDAWLTMPKRDFAAVMRQVAASSSLDCPECEVCCAIGLCCPLGSEQQRNALAALLLADGK